MLSAYASILKSFSGPVV